jgi:hypothetical protein
LTSHIHPKIYKISGIVWDILNLLQRYVYILL